MSDNDPGQTPDIPPAPSAPAYGAPQPSAYPPPPATPPAAPSYGQPVPPAQSPSGQPPQYGQPPHYGQPAQAPQYPYGAAPAYGAYAAPRKTNVLAVISMIASIVGFIWLVPFLGSLAGVIMGHISLRQIARTSESGRGMAIAGVIVGYVGLAFFVVGALFFVFFLTLGLTESTRYA